MTRAFRSTARGQSLVEFALALPLFILLLVVVFDLGRAVYAQNAVANASRGGARVAIVNQNSADIQQVAAQHGAALDLPESAVQVAFDCSSPYPLGCLAEVTVTYTYEAATPLVSAMVGSISIQASAAMPIERTCPNAVQIPPPVCLVP